ncbi:MAG: LPS export ABC transporter ATP-binding protein [Chromatiales bacterium]|nr:LPS export ABC transporter ATP-binding protein [Chromatiales bacterium]
MSVLRADGLTKKYRQRQVVNGVSLQVNSGEVVGLLGPNGAGKTTSFYMIVGLIRPDDGTICLDNHELTDTPMHTRARLGLGYLPQEASIFRRMTVEQNVLAVLQTRSELNHTERLERLEEVLDELHIAHLRESRAMSLSGGERRRLEIARALAVRPNFILLDEPFAGVDPLSVGEIQRIVTQLAERDIGILVTDHNVRETLGICQRAYIINQGQVLAEGNPDAILEHSEVREVYLGHNFRM